MTLLESCIEALEEDSRLRKTKDPFQSWIFLAKVAREIGIGIILDFKTLHGKPSPESILKERREILNGLRLKDRCAHLREPFVPEENMSYSPK